MPGRSSPGPGLGTDGTRGLGLGIRDWGSGRDSGLGIRDSGSALRLLATVITVQGPQGLADERQKPKRMPKLDS